MWQRSRWTATWRTLAVAYVLITGAAAADETADLASQVDEMFAEWNRSDAPGAAVAVVRDGRIVYENAFGMADLERGVALTPQSVFEIGSVSKQFTAMCILLLENDGKLSVEDDIRKYVPEMPAYEAPITLRHLLHHTSGVRDVETLIPLAGWPYVNYYRDAELLELITRQKGLNFRPGSEYLYSNSGYILLAQVVERVSGLALPEFAQKRIFGPLQMRHTTYWDDPTQIVANRAIPYSSKPGGGYAMELWNLPFDGPAGVYTTVGDLALWDANFYDNKLGGGAALIEEMETPGTLDDGEAIDYADGLVVTKVGERRVILHGGAWMAYRASLMRFPEEHLTVIRLANAAPFGVPTLPIANLYLDQDDESEEESETPPASPSAIELPATRLAEFTGTYWNEDDSLLRTIEVREGKLQYVRGAEGRVSELAAVADGRFVMVGVGVHVDVEFETGEDRTMTVSVEGEDSLLFHPVLSPGPEELAAYAGSFWSEELERELRLRPEGGRIQAEWTDDPQPSPAVVLAPDRLLVQQFVPVPWSPQDVDLRLERDASGQITGLRLSCEMVRGITFVRRP